MIVNIYQTITIQSMRVNSLTNSSVLQIGSAGIIKGLSNNYNTGKYTGPAPEPKHPETYGTPSAAQMPLVPLAAAE